MLLLGWRLRLETLRSLPRCQAVVVAAVVSQVPDRCCQKHGLRLTFVPPTFFVAFITAGSSGESHHAVCAVGPWQVPRQHRASYPERNRRERAEQLRHHAAAQDIRWYHWVRPWYRCCVPALAPNRVFVADFMRCTTLIATQFFDSAPLPSCPDCSVQFTASVENALRWLQRPTVIPPGPAFFFQASHVSL